MFYRMRRLSQAFGLSKDILTILYSGTLLLSLSACSRSKYSSAQAQTSGGAAQPAHAVDAAPRPQDPSFFERWCQPEYCPDLSVAARLMGNPLDAGHQRI